MKEEWLMPGAVVPVDPDTTKALVDEIKRLIGVIGGIALQQAEKRQWVGLTDEEFEDIELGCRSTSSGKIEAMQKVEAKLKEKNGLHRQHVIDGSPCWCEPETSYTDPETGASVVVHKEPQ
jgi:hypothetical protein